MPAVSLDCLHELCSLCKLDTCTHECHDRNPELMLSYDCANDHHVTCTYGDEDQGANRCPCQCHDTGFDHDTTNEEHDELVVLREQAKRVERLLRYWQSIQNKPEIRYAAKALEEAFGPVESGE
jgi:hypothetical protein